MAHRREQIIAAAVTALDGPGKPTGLSVHRFLNRLIQNDDLPALVVYVSSESTSEHEYGPGVRRELGLRVESRIAAGSGLSSDAALQPLSAWITKALMGDSALAAMIESIDEGTTVHNGAEGAQNVGAAAVEFPIVYHTMKNDPEVAPWS